MLALVNPPLGGGTSNEVVAAFSELPGTFEARSVGEAATLVFLERQPDNANGWEYQVYLCSASGNLTGRFTCKPQEVAERIAQVPVQDKP